MSDNDLPTKQQVEEIRAAPEILDADRTRQLLESLAHSRDASARFNRVLKHPEVAAAIEREAATLRALMPLDQIERGHYSYLQTLCKGQEIKVREADIQLAAVVRENQELKKALSEASAEIAAVDRAVLSETTRMWSQLDDETRARLMRENPSLASQMAALLPPKSPI